VQRQLVRDAEPAISPTQQHAKMIAALKAAAVLPVHGSSALIAKIMRSNLRPVPDVQDRVIRRSIQEQSRPVRHPLSRTAACLACQAGPGPRM